MQEADPGYKIAKFGGNTSTSTLRRHLAEKHIQAWVVECDKLQIEISTKLTQQMINEHRGVVSSGWIPFSSEAFVDALVAFVVGDDQVSPYSH
jgi:hypothetical protein